VIEGAFFKIGYKITTNYSNTQVFLQLFLILSHFIPIICIIQKKVVPLHPEKS